MTSAQTHPTLFGPFAAFSWKGKAGEEEGCGGPLPRRSEIPVREDTKSRNLRLPSSFAGPVGKMVFEEPSQILCLFDAI